MNFIIILVVLQHFDFSASETFPGGIAPVILPSEKHCMFDRNVGVTLSAIKNCCEIELKCLKFDEDGQIASLGTDDTTTFGKTIKRNLLRCWF